MSQCNFGDDNAPARSDTLRRNLTCSNDELVMTLISDAQHDTNLGTGLRDQLLCAISSCTINTRYEGVIWLLSKRQHADTARHAFQKLGPQT